jgi:Flp pilus assembly protein protease CpaA
MLWNVPANGVDVMRQVYFSDPWFAWLFYTALMGLLSIAAYTDWRRMVVPKSLTLPALALGVVANLVRGALLGHKELPGWALSPDGAWLGAVDGLLFSLAGFGLAFVLFLVLWLLGTCGGGDVKLMAAVGAWIGPSLVVIVTAVTLVLVFVMVMVTFSGRLLSGRLPDLKRKPGSKSRLTSYAATVAVSAAVVLLFSFRVDLGLVAAPPVAPPQEAVHAR